MSRNCNSTDCACGLWRFETSHGTAAVDDPALLKQTAYWSAHYPDGTLGYGFRDDLHGNVYMWRQRNDAGRVVSTCNAPREGYARELGWTYAVPNRVDRYRWKRIDCPICHRAYAGWYVQQPSSLDPPRFELYDTSYWFAGNDEPCDEDRALVIEWTHEQLAAAAREYTERHSEQWGGPGR